MTFCHLSGSSSLMFSVKLRKFLYENAFDEIFHPVSIRDMCFAATEKCYQSVGARGKYGCKSWTDHPSSRILFCVIFTVCWLSFSWRRIFFPIDEQNFEQIFSLYNYTNLQLTSFPRAQPLGFGCQYLFLSIDYLLNTVV